MLRCEAARRPEGRHTAIATMKRVGSCEPGPPGLQPNARSVARVLVYRPTGSKTTPGGTPEFQRTMGFYVDTPPAPGSWTLYAWRLPLRALNRGSAYEQPPLGLPGDPPWQAVTGAQSARPALSWCNPRAPILSGPVPPCFPEPCRVTVVSLGQLLAAITADGASGQESQHPDP